MAFTKLFLGATVFVSVSVAINEDSAKESPCLNITNAVDPDATWFSSIQTWYYPLASRLDLYRSVHDLLETDYRSIPEYSLYYDSCLEWGINADGFTLNGYNGKSRFLRTTPVGPGTSDFKSDWSQGMIGRAYTTLTDNKTFAFTAACFADDQMSWNVFATTKELNEATKQKIFEHAKSLGYKPEYFTEIRYDSCKSKSNSSIVNTTGALANEGTSLSSLENEIFPTANMSTIGPSVQTENSLTCDTCTKICPALISKTVSKRKYYKKWQKYRASEN